ncbi:hypothetical protein ACTFIV_005593 [Dictyostelium citrinum]
MKLSYQILLDKDPSPILDSSGDGKQFSRIKSQELIEFNNSPIQQSETSQQPQSEKLQTQLTQKQYKIQHNESWLKEQSQEKEILNSECHEKFPFKSTTTNKIVSNGAGLNSNDCGF